MPSALALPSARASASDGVSPHLKQTIYLIRRPSARVGAIVARSRGTRGSPLHSRPRPSALRHETTSPALARLSILLESAEVLVRLCSARCTSTRARLTSVAEQPARTAENPPCDRTRSDGGQPKVTAKRKLGARRNEKRREPTGPAAAACGLSDSIIVLPSFLALGSHDAL